MIHVDMKMPDGTEQFFLLDEHACVQTILLQLAELLGETGAHPACLWDDLTGLVLRTDENLYRQGIVSGCRLRLENGVQKDSGEEASDVSL